MNQPEPVSHVVVEGTGRPVVLIHGVLADHRMWRLQVCDLARDHRVICYDMLGHGDSSDPPGERSLADFTGQLQSVIAKHCQFERPVVVGFSMGGLIAQAYAIEHSHELSGVVILNAVYDRTPTEREAVGLRLDALERLGMNSVIDAATTRWFTPQEQAAHTDIIEEIFGLMRDGDQAAKLKAYRVFATSDGETAGRLRAIQCPALVMTGDGDAVSPPHMAVKMADAIPNARSEILSNQRHMMPMLDADTLNRHLREFLSSL